MTPKEKSKQLFEKIFFEIQSDELGRCYQSAKQCALIAVEEIKEAIFWHPYESPNFELEYWQEVKIEIQAL